MPDMIVTLNDILVAVFCKSGTNVWYLFFAQKNKNKIVIELNRKLFNFFGEKNNNLKQYYTSCFMLKPFFVFDPALSVVDLGFVVSLLGRRSANYPALTSWRVAVSLRPEAELSDTNTSASIRRWGNTAVFCSSQEEETAALQNLCLTPITIVTVKQVSFIKL